GFDVVIGNPPYVEAADNDKDYYKANYPAIEGHIDLFEIFIQKGIIPLNLLASFQSFNRKEFLRQ
ncbi:MAG: Eco57I restriction-modification methylase domain-containing protein, partial [Alphaproteobacteria bacterium]|nr:Eco57I restriction-modification methylase domain-containing protein [Alphaproteobacteria bacterium]